MNETEIKLIETTSTEVKNRLVGPEEILRAIDTGVLYVGGKGGVPQALVTAIPSGEGLEFSAGEMSIQMVRSIRVPVKRSVFASLVAGTTYGQSGNTVTVAATAHGIPNTCNGMRFY